MKLIDQKTLDKWGAPCWARKAKIKQQKFAIAMDLLKDELMKRGINLKMPVDKVTSKTKILFDD